MPVGFDEVMICNMALSIVGSKTTIENIDESTPAAKQCKIWYEPARLAMLEAFDWDFARKSKELSAHSVAAPLNRWNFRYQIPADCIAPRVIENPAGPVADAIPYEQENAGNGTMSIVTDMEDAVLLYTFDLDSPVLFSMHAVETHAFALAERIAYKMTGKRTLAEQLRNGFEAKVGAAHVANAIKSIPRPEQDALTIRARQ
jgi:hypothetical protein